MRLHDFADWAAAIRDGDVDTVENNLGRFEARADARGETGLIHAARAGQVAIGLLLAPIEAGSVSNSGLTALMVAAEQNCAPLVESLLPGEGEILAPGGVSALMIASQHASLDAIQLLKPSQWELLDDEGHSALFYAVSSGSQEAVRLVVQNSYKVVAPDVSEAKKEAEALGFTTIAQYLRKFSPDEVPTPVHPTSNYAAAVGGLTPVEKYASMMDTAHLAPEVQLGRSYEEEDCTVLPLDQGGEPVEEQGQKAVRDRAFVPAAPSFSLSPMPTPTPSPDTQPEHHSHPLRPGLEVALAGSVLTMSEAVHRAMSGVGSECNAEEQTTMFCVPSFSGNAAKLPPLLYAAYTGQIREVEMHIGSGHFKTDDGYTALMLAAQCGHTRVVGRLAHMQAGLRLPHTQTTAMMLAALMGHASCMRPLIGFEAGLRDLSGYTALIVAAERGHAAAAKALVKKERGLCDAQGLTALMHAANGGHVAVVKALARHEARIRSPDGCTALIFAVRRGFGDVVKVLAKREAKVQDSRGWTALMYAASLGRTEYFKLLRSEMGLQDLEGRTALMCAAAIGDLAACLALRAREGHLTDKEGRCAAEYAAGAGHEEVRCRLQG